ncbi:MAG TPA: hypothetical protein VNJ05_08985 [Sphingomicrobium sp.]|nr:hypothetical protein [Sphingomicrobium sp.]
MEYSPISVRVAERDCRRRVICSLVDFCSGNDRVCPAPSAWHRLWRMLPRDGQGRLPPHPPAYLAGRDAAADNELKWALVDHLLWADSAGVIDKVDRYLRSLPPDQWWLKAPA